MSKHRGLNPALFIALADVMMCWGGLLYIQQNRDKIELEIEIDQLEAKKAEAETDAAQAEVKAEAARREAEDDQKRLEEETAKKKAMLDARISDIEAQLSKRQDDFQNWDLVVNRYYHKNKEERGMTRRPDAHLYLRQSGIYRDGSRQKMSDEEIRGWLAGQATAAASMADGRVLVACWQENGANDGYIRMLDILDKDSELSALLAIHTIILPSGVEADASQKGSERIAKPKKEGEQ